MTDKLKHFLAGAFFGALAFPLSFFIAIDTAILVSLIVGSIVFVGKEVFDKYKEQPTGFDANDLFFDYFGWLIGVLFGVILFVIKFYLFL